MKLQLNNKWMFAYSIAFVFLSASFIENDFFNNYPKLYLVWVLFFYIIANAGNFIYSLGISLHGLRKYWKVVFLLIIFGFIFSYIIDFRYGSAMTGDGEFLSSIFSAVVGVVLFFPTFRANFKLAYKKRTIE
jgi:hypothetical protein